MVGARLRGVRGVWMAGIGAGNSDHTTLLQATGRLYEHGRLLGIGSELRSF
uniref:Uncharacterized protein n=1 Tax=Setaria viridis TaxID=4556 RepID=A0A4V6D7U9_SETVI|nr:hypothetical protein SEVIR_4G035402v2 [Setaria viridis]TKW19667.1 hypothetical protein SEVIR_4G035402v2 [Setaria viridis]